ncbi:MAG: hypothetical protein OSJ54_06115 [Oscillospiraceae bacterium]|nr:hypothetical protein [Oscillospiraceae bacterium]
MALGSVNVPGANGAELSDVKSTADSAMSKANANESEIAKVKKTADTALTTAQNAKDTAENHTHNYAGSSSPGGAATTALACTGNSATATKATNDSSGQQITSTYIKGLAVDGLSISYTKGNGNTGKISLDEEVTAKVRQLSRFSDYFRLV